MRNEETNSVETGDKGAFLDNAACAASEWMRMRPASRHQEEITEIRERCLYFASLPCIV